MDLNIKERIQQITSETATRRVKSGTVGIFISTRRVEAEHAHACSNK
jgi:hypothetical protein